MKIQNEIQLEIKKEFKAGCDGKQGCDWDKCRFCGDNDTKLAAADTKQLVADLASYLGCELRDISLPSGNVRRRPSAGGYESAGGESDGARSDGARRGAKSPSAGRRQGGGRE